MPEEITPAEQSYFDTRGANALPEAAPAVEPAAAPSEAKPPEPAAKAEEPKTVPIQAVHEAREEARRVKEQLAQREADFNRLTGRLSVLEGLAKGGTETPKPPDWDSQPIDAGKALAGDVQQVKQALESQARFSQLASAVTAQETEFRAKAPDYNDAVTHLRNQRSAELSVLGYSPVDVQNIIGQEAMQIAQRALQTGKNPGEIVYNLALQRGYKKAETAKPAADPAKVLDTIAKGQNAAQSIAASPGSPPAKTGLEAILEMDDAEFAKVSDKDWKKLFA